ncbi:MAG TPA: hypothetical protein VFP68_01845 [Burkholderiaceae bacterium]|nr:hypothetical protein [Burkholderiaceae bacterium]
MPNHPSDADDATAMPRNTPRASHRGMTGRRHDQLVDAPAAVDPRLPHERDESSDSQVLESQRDIIRQGQQDLQRGLQDTSRAQATNEAYERQKRGAGAVPDQSGAGVGEAGVPGPGERKSRTAPNSRKPSSGQP